MRVFVTGATGFIGSRVVRELIGVGCQVVGMTRSDAGAAALAAAGAGAHRADLEDFGALRAGAAKADAVIHTAFDHNFSRFAENCAKDGRVIEALAAELKDGGRPLLITSSVGMGARPEGPAVETVFDTHHPNPRIASELAGAAALEAGVDVRVVRLPQVHDPVRQGLVTPYIAMCRQKGEAAYVGDGGNLWSAGHVDDVATLYRLVLERGRGGERYNAVAEEGIGFRRIAETVGAGLGAPVRSIPPEEVAGYFGWLAIFAGLGMAASSALTRSRLGWTPTGPGLIADLERMDYSAEA